MLTVSYVRFLSVQPPSLRVPTVYLYNLHKMGKCFKRYLQRNLIRDIINNANIRNSKKMFGMAFLLLVKLFLSYIIRQKQ